MLQPTPSTEGVPLKIYTAHHLMNQRETGGRGDKGRTEMDERRGGREASGRRKDEVREMWILAFRCKE